jgi:hypothetical protein
MILNGENVLHVAVEIDRELLSGDMADCPKEPDNMKKLRLLLPEYLQRLGPIVDVSAELYMTVTVKNEAALGN